MSLRDKYTKEEWDAIPPFKGFSFNKTIDEKIEEARETMKQRIVNSFTSGMNRDTDFTHVESGNYKFADNISVEEMMVERLKKENQPRDVIQNIVDKIHERKLSGKECAVAIMSYSDYDAIQSMHDFETHSIWISGSLLRIHSSINLKDGEIEIY